MSLTLARVFRTAYNLLADGFHEDKFILPDHKVDKDLENNIIHNESHFNQVETALLIDLNSELHQNRLESWVCIEQIQIINMPIQHRF